MKYKYYICITTKDASAWIARCPEDNIFPTQIGVEFLDVDILQWVPRDNNPNFIRTSLYFDTRRNAIRQFKKIEGGGHKINKYPYG